MQIGQHHVHAGLHDAKRACRQHGAFVIKARHQHVDAAALGAQDVLGGHEAVLEHQLAGVGPAHAQLVEFLRRRKTFHAALDDKGGDAFGACVDVGLGIDDQHMRVGAVGDPHLVAVEDIAAVGFVGAQLHRHDVRTGARLAHGKRADFAAGAQVGQVFLFLRLVAVQRDLVDAKVRECAVGQADAGRRAADFFHRHDMFDIAKARTAEFLGHGDAQQAKRAHLLPQLVGEGVAAVDFGRARGDAVLGETAHGFANHLGVLAQRKAQAGVVEGRGGIGLGMRGGGGGRCGGSHADAPDSQ